MNETIINTGTNLFSTLPIYYLPFLYYFLYTVETLLNGTSVQCKPVFSEIILYSCGSYIRYVINHLWWTETVQCGNGKQRQELTENILYLGSYYILVNHNIVV